MMCKLESSERRKSERNSFLACYFLAAQVVRSGEANVQLLIVQCLERLQRGKEDDNKEGIRYIKRKQELWDAQYLQHRDNLTSIKGAYEATYILVRVCAHASASAHTRSYM